MSQLAHPRTGTRPADRRPSTLKIATLSGLLAGVGAAQASAQNATAPGGGVANTATQHDTTNSQSKAMRVALPDITAEFQVQTPNAKESLAVRVVNARLPQHNIERTLYARVVVGVENEEVLKRALGQASAQLGLANAGFRPVGDMQDVYVVELGSVEEAIRMAAELKQVEGVEWTEIEHRAPRQNLSLLGGGTITADPTAPFQWHVFDTGLFPSGFDNNHRIDQAYADGVTGQGVTVGILEAFNNSFYHVDDSGVLQIHPDLINQTDFDLSIETDPFNELYTHGVSVAGIVGAEGNNGLFGSGVAYNARLASLRNGSSIDSGESFMHALNEIEIINNSWGPLNESFPGNNTGKYPVDLPDDFEIDIPQVTHSGISRIDRIGIDRAIRLGRNGDGRVLVFSAGNGSHFQGWDRFALGNAISLPGIGMDPDIPGYGYLDITGMDPADNDFDGIPDTFILDGAPTNGDGDPALGWRWSGHFGDRTEYNSLTSYSRTLAIASVGMSNARSGYSTTGTAVFAGAYAQDSVKAREFDPDNQLWGTAVSGLGILTLEQEDGTNDDGLSCNAIIPGLNFADEDLETCLFNGTSAAAPIASGIIALMLEANPSLTLRDVMHIIQQTAIVPETGPSDPAVSDFYDTTKSYWPSIFLGLGAQDPDSGDPPQPTFWTTNNAGVRHSDEYGFGIIDAGAAVEAAETWPGVGRLFALSSGLIEAGDDGGNPNFTEGMIEDAVFEDVAEVSENLETWVLVPGIRLTIPLTCIRDNLRVEGVELTVNIDGDGAGDLMIALESPRGTISPLALPRGDSNGLDGTAYSDHTFSTYKHWDELSGGTWLLHIQDFRPDMESPEGEPPDEDPSDPPTPEELGVEAVTYLGVFGLPGAGIIPTDEPGDGSHDEKTLVSYELRIFGTEQGEPVFEGCPPLLTGCPGDLNGDGTIDARDLNLYVSWYLANDPFADLTEDGVVNIFDITFYLSIWIPGPCNSGGPAVDGPGTSNDNDPIIRPI